MCTEIGIKYLVIHPNSNKNKEDRTLTLNKIIDRLNKLLKIYKNLDLKGRKTILLLENTAYFKSIGYIKELEYIINKIQHQELIGICLDTCHLFSLELDLNNLNKTNKFLLTIESKFIKLLHFNNSQYSYLSNRDKHASFEQGEIKLSSMKNFLYGMISVKKQNFDILLETPFTTQDKDIKILRK